MEAGTWKFPDALGRHGGYGEEAKILVQLKACKVFPLHWRGSRKLLKLLGRKNEIFGVT